MQVTHMARSSEKGFPVLRDGTEWTCFGSDHAGDLALFVFLAGQVSSLSYGLDKQVFHRLAACADGQIIPADAL